MIPPISETAVFSVLSGDDGHVRQALTEIKQRSDRMIVLAQFFGEASLLTWGFRPITLRFEGSVELAIHEEACEPKHLFRAVRIQRDPIPALEHIDNAWYALVLEDVREALLGLGAETVETESVADGFVPIGATSPTPDEGVVVGAIRCDVLIPVLIEGLGIVRVDANGLVTVREVQDGEWSGPFPGASPP